MENKVWFYRTKQNMSLRELSRKTGISVANLDKIENGNTHDILLSNAIALSKALHVDLYELFCIKI
jgi:transcriptional regulator with XRE-family HTH domain